MVENYIEAIGQLIRQVIKTIPLGILIGMVVLMIMKLLNKKNKLAVVILAMYLSMIIQGTILFRPIGQINEIVLKPFPIVGGARYMILYAIANALVFIPLGTLLPFVWNRAKNVKVCVLMGFLMSLFIETMQLILCCGVVQTEDLIMNTLGTYIGYILYRVIKNKRA
ncbi:VanZ family protein [Eubacterium sp. CAG:161]|uniref:VanZ family protein n=1 Tax=Eubacterium sp. CAG:161 TaxID=1262881 RepID=UPI00033CC0C3|nr:VanZ family protein [Eubacterium sp. CAG:161]CCY70080.1 putative uncharacterized protein [Eubacterium sp. CAG:161]